MKQGLFGFVVGAVTGAALAYFFDSTQGARRRAIVRDKVNSGVSQAERGIEAAVSDLGNRMTGIAADFRSMVLNKPASDEVLAERVRSRIGRASQHPGAIEVSVDHGRVTLGGPVLAHEARDVSRAAESGPGVPDVVDRLESHEEPGNVPGLQGGVPRVSRPDILQQDWAPATRMLVAGGGALAAVAAVARPSLASPLLVGAGLAMVVRAIANIEFRRLLGQGGQRGIDFIKTMHINAPVEAVFETWANFETFPQFMRNVRSVRRNPDNSWHWEVTGPMGTSVEWDAAVTDDRPGELIAWATRPGAQVEHAGIVRYEREDGGTRVHVRMSYNPPAGAVGHVVASLFGADPGSELDEDMMRLKSWFETGRLPRDAAMH